MTITDQLLARIAEIRSVAEKATTGPWFADYLPDEIYATYGKTSAEQAHRNRYFCAQSRTILPNALAALEEAVKDIRADMEYLEEGDETDHIAVLGFRLAKYLALLEGKQKL